MKIVVVAQRDLRPLLDDWRRTLPGTRDQRQSLANALWDEFVKSIVDAGGVPKDAWEDTTTDPPTYWCNFPGGLAQIVVEPPQRVGLFSTEQRVIVVDLNFSPGLPG